MGQASSQPSMLLLEAAALGNAQAAAAAISSTSDPAQLVASATTGRFHGAKTALHVAAEAGKPGVITAVLQPLVAAVAAEMADGLYPGEVAAALGSIINRADSRGRSPLLTACERGDAECADVLLEAGANVFAVDRDGNSVLHAACLRGHLGLVLQLLVKAEAQAITHRLVDALNLGGFTPLHYAAWGGHAEVVRSLLAAGANQQLKTCLDYDRWLVVPLGSTALHTAALRQHADICLALLQQYALTVRDWLPGEPRLIDPRALLDDSGATPLQLAVWKGLNPSSQLAACLNHRLAITALFTPLELDELRRRGPPALKILAAKAVQGNLLQQLDALQQRQRRQQQLLRLRQQQEKERRQQQQQHSEDSQSWQRWWQHSGRMSSEPSEAQEQHQQHQQGEQHQQHQQGEQHQQHQQGEQQQQHEQGEQLQHHQEHSSGSRSRSGSAGASSSGGLHEIRLLGFSGPAGSGTQQQQQPASTDGSITSDRQRQKEQQHAELLQGLRRTPSVTLGAIQYVSMHSPSGSLDASPASSSCDDMSAGEAASPALPFAVDATDRGRGFSTDLAASADPFAAAACKESGRNNSAAGQPAPCTEPPAAAAAAAENAEAAEASCPATDAEAAPLLRRSSITVGCLERIWSYKEQQEQQEVTVAGADADDLSDAAGKAGSRAETGGPAAAAARTHSNGSLPAAMLFEIEVTDDVQQQEQQETHEQSSCPIDVAGNSSVNSGAAAAAAGGETSAGLSAGTAGSSSPYRLINADLHRATGAMNEFALVSLQQQQQQEHWEHQRASGASSTSSSSRSHSRPPSAEGAACTPFSPAQPRHLLHSSSITLAQLPTTSSSSNNDVSTGSSTSAAAAATPHGSIIASVKQQRRRQQQQAGGSAAIPGALSTAGIRTDDWQQLLTPFAWKLKQQQQQAGGGTAPKHRYSLSSIPACSSTVSTSEHPTPRGCKSLTGPGLGQRLQVPAAQSNSNTQCARPGSAAAAQGCASLPISSSGAAAAAAAAAAVTTATARLKTLRRFSMGITKLAGSSGSPRTAEQQSSDVFPGTAQAGSFSAAGGSHSGSLQAAASRLQLPAMMGHAGWSHRGGNALSTTHRRSFELPGSSGGMQGVFGASSQHISQMLQAAGSVGPRSFSVQKALTRAGSLAVATSLAGALPGCVSEKLSQLQYLEAAAAAAASSSSAVQQQQQQQQQCGHHRGSLTGGTVTPTGAASAFGDGVSSCCTSSETPCAVCFDKPPVVALDGCCHLLCFECAGCIVREGVGCRPPLCPFCRRTISGFGLTMCAAGAGDDVLIDMWVVQ